MSELFWNSQVKPTRWAHREGFCLTARTTCTCILLESIWSCSYKTVIVTLLESPTEPKAGETDEVCRLELKSMEPSDKREPNKPVWCCVRFATNWRRTWWRDRLYKPRWSVVITWRAAGERSGRRSRPGSSPSRPGKPKTGGNKKTRHQKAEKRGAPTLPNSPQQRLGVHPRHEPEWCICEFWVQTPRPGPPFPLQSVQDGIRWTES